MPRDGKVWQKKQRKKYMTVLGYVFLVALFGLTIVNLLMPDRESSQTEKRKLAQMPGINLQSITDGSFDEKFEEYASDQVAFRPFWIQVKALTDTLLGQNLSQGVYRGKNGYFMEKMEEVNTDNLSATLQAMTHFSEQAQTDTVFVLVPNASRIYEEYLPNFAITEDQAEWMEWISNEFDGSDIQFLDLTDTLLAAKGDVDTLYYRTDHHWTTEAAYLALPAVAEVLELTLPDETYQEMIVCADFKGSLLSKSGYFGSVLDTVKIYAPEKETAYLLTNTELQTRTATVYSMEGLESNDPYTVFLGGNFPHLNIVTEQVGKGRLLVFKDSYFNCFLPFLLSAYEEIDIIDPRYYYGDLKSLLYQKDYDKILFFYNLGTFVEDTSLQLILK